MMTLALIAGAVMLVCLGSLALADYELDRVSRELEIWERDHG